MNDKPTWQVYDPDTGSYLMQGCIVIYKHEVDTFPPLVKARAELAAERERADKAVAELDAARARLAEAEALLRDWRFTHKERGGYPTRDLCDRTDAFLAPAPDGDLEDDEPDACPLCGVRLAGPDGSPCSGCA